jgi:predicted nucleic acid-binding protein
VAAFVDTNILVRHLTGDPEPQAARATAYLASATELLPTDLITAETVSVLASFHETPRAQVAEAMRSLLAFDTIVCVDPALLLRAIEVYEVDRVDFARPTSSPAPRAPTCRRSPRSTGRSTGTRLEPPAPPSG